MNLKEFLAELKRRNVIKSAMAYLVISWIIIQVTTTVLPTFGTPQYVTKTIIFILGLGFPLWLMFAWVYEITPDGIKKTVTIKREDSITPQTSNRLNKIIIGALSIAIILLVINLVIDKSSVSGIPNDTTNDITSKKDKSIAVLAFADMSPQKDQEYFSDGISEEILNLLAKIPDLKVISRTSSFAYKGKEENISKIGEELKVEHVLEGSIRKSGNTFRITAQLIKVSDGAHIWSETYDRDMTDIFKIQDEIAGKVTQQLKATLLGEIASTTVDPKAYDLYLQAKQVGRQGNEEAFKNAETLIRQSIAIDSNYAPAWAYLSSIIYNQIYRFLTLPMTEENINKGKEAAKKVILLDPNEASGYSGLAIFEQSNWDFAAANDYIKKALALAPENADVLGKAANNATNFGKLEEALQFDLKAVELDPLNYSRNYNLAIDNLMKKDYDNAIKYLQTFLLHYPNAAGAHHSMAMAYLGQGDNDSAIKEIEKEPEVFWKLYGKCMVVYAMGNKTEANTLLKEFVDTYGSDSWPNIASVYAFRGERDEAFKWLDKAYENRDGSTLEILNYPEFENLWGDPRWNAFLDKLKLPKDHGFHRD